MKLLQIYCLYDTVTREGSTLFTANNHDHALRIKEESLRQDRYPEDKELWYMGDYNVEGHDITDLEHGPEKITPSVKHIEETTNAGI